MSCRNGQSALIAALRHTFMASSCHNTAIRTFSSAARFQARRAPIFGPDVPRQQVITRSNGPIDPKVFGPPGTTIVPKDEQISDERVCVVDEKGNVGRPQYKSTVLKSFDRKEFFLIKIVDGNQMSMPLCKIVPKAKIYAQERASNPGGKAQKDKKEIEIPWKAADGDIDHKLKIASEFLEEGKKVEVVLIARRPREVLKDEAQAQAVIDNVRAKIAKLENVKETLVAGNIMGRTFAIHLEGPKVEKIKKKQQGRTAKEVEMLWNITDEEIESKRFRIAELLQSDVPVDLKVHAKRTAFQIPEEEGEKVFSRIWKQISTIPGLQELEPREGEYGKILTLHLGNAPLQKSH